MARVIRTIEQKLQTKISKIVSDRISIVNGSVKVDDILLFKYSGTKIDYTRNRFFPRLKEDIVEDEFIVTILLDHETLNILSSNILKPPKGAGIMFDIIKVIKPDINHIIIGGTECKIDGSSFYVTVDIYLTLLAINREEGVDKKKRVRSRISPFLKSKFGLEISEDEEERDYSLLLQEIIASKKISQSDIIVLSKELEVGDNSEVVIKRQINKQTDWLLSAIQEIVDKPKLTKKDAQDLGHDLFKFPRSSISGPESLMEKILTKYGQNIIFGVPALLNTKKYVVSASRLPRCQFDILLINYLSDIEIVELKRPDEYLFEYDSHRNKFYINKTLGTATAQCERYISTLYKDNDPDFTIDGKKIKEYINEQFGGTISLSICRPKALIIIGAIQRLAKGYNDLSIEEKAKISKREYDDNLEMAYKELKSSFKNIEIATYTEIIEGARLRFQLENLS